MRQTINLLPYFANQGSYQEIPRRPARHSTRPFRESSLLGFPGIDILDGMSEEIFDVVNDRNEVVGQEVRSVVHRQSLKHRAVHVLVFNARGELFLQKRSMAKDCFPGTWDSSASGHLDHGEAYDACAIREVREELGYELSRVPDRLFEISARPETGQEFVWVYRAELEGPFNLQWSEVEAGGWFAPEVVTHWTHSSPRDFAPAFVLIWKMLQTAR